MATWPLCVLSNLTWSLSNPKLHNSVTIVSYAAPVTEKRNAIHVHSRHDPLYTQKHFH